MGGRIVLALVLTGLFACATGCKKQVDHAVFLSAINKSFVGRHECVWPEPIKLPAQADPSKDNRIRDFEALAERYHVELPICEEVHKVVIGEQRPVDAYRALRSAGHESDPG